MLSPDEQTRIRREVQFIAKSGSALTLGELIRIREEELGRVEFILRVLRKEYIAKLRKENGL
jgi:hypothetical protein